MYGQVYQIAYSPSAKNWAEEENKCVKINT